MDESAGFRFLPRSGVLTVLLLVFTPLPASAAPAAGEPDFPALLADYRALAPSPDGIPLRDRTARIGHLELHFEKGTLFPLVTPRGATLGFLFEGQGQYTYRTEDSTDREALLIKLTQVSPGPAFNGFALSDPFQRILLVFARAEFQDLLSPATGTAGESPPGAARLARDDFDRIWKRFQRNNVGHDHLAAEARLNREAGSHVYAQIEARPRTVVYDYDTLRLSHEYLGLLRKVSRDGNLFVEPLSRQPIPGERQPHYGSLSLRDARIVVDLRDRTRSTIVSDLSLEAAQDGVRIASFYLSDRLRAGAEDDPSAEEGLRVRHVTDGKGRSLLFSHRYHELLVELPEPVSWGDTLKLRVETEGNLFDQAGVPPGVRSFALAGVPWYPSPTGWSPDGFTFSLRVRTLKPLRPVTTGRALSLREEGDEFDLEAASVVPVRRVAVLAGDYRITRAEVGGHTVRYYGLEFPSSEPPALAGDLLASFEKLLGPYPFGDLDVIETRVYGFGAALPGMVLVPGAGFKPRDDYFGRYYNRGIRWRIAHEVARQWFGQKVFPAAPRDAWLSESLAEYLGNLVSSGTYPVEERGEKFRAGLEEWRWEAKGCRDRGSLSVAGLLLGESTGSIQFCLLYNRGPLVLHLLRSVTGDEAFFALLRRTLEQAHLDLVSEAGFRKAGEEETRSDLGWFFEDWIQRGGIPEIQVTYDFEYSDAGAGVLSGHASQTDGPDFRRIVVPLVLDFDDGHRESRVFFQDRPGINFRFELPEKPRRIRVDPDHHTPALYR